MGRYIHDLKTKYIENLAIYHNIDRIEELIAADTFSPILKVLPVHEDEAPVVREHNTMLSELVMDLNAINLELSGAAYSYYDLLSEYEIKFKEIKDSLQAEYEIQSDLNMLCNAYTEFDDIITISPEQLSTEDETSVTSNIITIPPIDNSKVTLTITGVNGNGYAGNSHVYDSANEVFLSDSLDTSKTENLFTNNENEYYEYSRLVSGDISNSAICADVNNDSNAVRCTIYLKSDAVFNTIRVNSSQKYLRIVDIYTSLDGLSYSVLTDFHDFDFNNTDNKYTINNYILNSGIFNIPDSKYIKITFESFDYNESETIACTGKTITGSVNPSVINDTTVLNNTQRYYIRIDSIEAFRTEYEDNHIVISDELISDTNSDICSLAIFANEYVPNIDNDVNKIADYIQYYLIVNDKEYEMIPINRNINYNLSESSKIKIIRAANNLNQSLYTEYMNDSIKNVRLKIVLNAVDMHNSPYVSNIKILRGILR